MNGIFDSHAHYDDNRFNKDREQVLHDITINGVMNVINVGCDIKSSKASIDLSEQYNFIYASVGVHPHEAVGATDNYIEQLTALSKHKKVVAIGEIGLDYHYDFSPRDVQKQVFIEQLKLAQKINMPVIIHSREAVSDMMAILNEYKPCGVVHCFTGSAQAAIETIKLGMYIGFTGVVTFPNARKTLEVIDVTPLDRLLLETDCPYMAPVPYRGKRTTSDMIVETAKTIAKVKGISTQEIIDIAKENTNTLFGINQE